MLPPTQHYPLPNRHVLATGLWNSGKLTDSSRTAENTPSPFGSYSAMGRSAVRPCLGFRCFTGCATTINLNPVAKCGPLNQDGNAPLASGHSYFMPKYGLGQST